MTIGGATRVACVIGDPVEHSRSPLMHNAAAAALGLDRVYVALRVAPDDLERALRGLAALGFDGANVTLPHKAGAAALCDELGDEARDAGAVNTLSFAAGGGLRGDLTDGLGLIAALERVPERAVVLGAGGSSRAAAAALLRAGTRQLAIVARRPDAAAELAASLAALEPAARVEAAAEVSVAAGGLLVNCTPVGGISDLKALPVPADVIERMDAVADFAYRADGSPTPLAAAALAAGLPVVDGLELLVRQGALSFQRWTGIEPPLDVMRRAARGRVSAAAAALAALGGGLGALVWEPLEPRLTARSEGADELLEQPPWTRTVTSRPVLMLVSAIVCGAAGLRFGATRELIPALVLAFALVGISAVDLRYRIIPDRITLPLAIAGLVLGAALRFSDLPELGLAAFGAGLFLLLAALMAPSGMGIGDVKLVFVLGLFLGRTVVVAVIVGLFSVIVPTLAVLPSKGLRARKMHLALGPFLALGGMVALLAGDDVIDWYTGD